MDWTGGSGMVISTALQTLYQTLVKKVGQGGSIGQVGLKENREGVAEDPGIFTEVLRASENPLTCLIWGISWQLGRGPAVDLERAGGITSSIRLGSAVGLCGGGD